MEEPAKQSLISKVFPANVMIVWPQVSVLLKPAVDRVRTHGVEDIRRIILAGYADLWVQLRGNVCEAAMVTEFKHYPRGIWLNLWLAGAEKNSKFDDALWEPYIIQFAEANGCTGINWMGRKGWRERNKHLPINCEHVTYSVMLRDLRRAAA